ncbi:cell wall-binding repeat-containing protein [Herbiconiux daphne]|uniref:Cell wall-binding repeat-containing protein n=1 Tax=Herbiconiux daphne TaxID=2970914 RepID=A0ABT2H378_9MICO|nr:cell wall-binding repeat-containing protein [Herbiconiux daphne]MCS5734395.1 cell wall-binding repeat-containing protein [Herbiconiux daphne]
MPPLPRLRRPLRSLALTLALGTALIGVVCTSPVGTAHATEDVSPTISRIDGADRYAVAVKASSTGFTSASIVYIASGEKFADALSATSVAGWHNSPLLLTPAASLLPNVAAEVTRLHPTTIVVVGGTASVSDDVLEQLSRAATGATVLRIGGADRFEVSRALLQEPTVGVFHVEGVIVATGATFPDALTASPVATANMGVVLLVNGTENAPTAVETSLIGALRAGGVVIAGGNNSVSASFENELRNHFATNRRAGADRFEVGANINNWGFANGATTAYLASGLTFPDALSGGSLAAHDRAPLYVVQQNCVPSSVLNELDRLKPSRIVLLGGINTLGAGVANLQPC